MKTWQGSRELNAPIAYVKKLIKKNEFRRNNNYSK
jgi:hypothetical protein